MSLDYTIAIGAHYYSTACLHQGHDHCRLTCKFCDAPCRCACHATTVIGNGAVTVSATQAQP